ncbi:ataxin-2 homolog isoform X2 [Venturia canescens]|uniref:ataxin-2 homolog isoform X2 n=1 Tax=Venturia canescens TaxID=32260 RepID=UPI001C9C000F|nr:ataxin-2 homolog isoform X2 [Venturia canescens]
MTKYFIFFALSCTMVMGGPPSNGIRPSNLLGGSDQHASFSFVRPGLTQTSFSFNGPSSHQSFTSSIGNPHLAQKVLPNVANALAYRNPGLGYFSTAPVSNGYANIPNSYASNVPLNPGAAAAYSYQQQGPIDQATAQAYLNQYQHYQQQAQTQAYLQQQQNQQYPDVSSYQLQLGQLLALRQQQAQLQLQANAQNQNQGHTSHHVPVHETSQQIPEQVQLQQQVQQEHQPSQSLLGVAFSSAPSVAHVKVSGNGYKFDF